LYVALPAGAGFGPLGVKFTLAVSSPTVEAVNLHAYVYAVLFPFRTSGSLTQFVRLAVSANVTAPGEYVVAVTVALPLR
jgi:hypothetical protein